MTLYGTDSVPFRTGSVPFPTAHTPSSATWNGTESVRYSHWNGSESALHSHWNGTESVRYSWIAEGGTASLALRTPRWALTPTPDSAMLLLRKRTRSIRRTCGSLSACCLSPSA
jgi:hypothetical protein